MKKTVKIVFSWLMALLLFFSTTMTNPIIARAEESKSVTLKISCGSGMTVPESYQINYNIFDSTGTEAGWQAINGNSEGSVVSQTVSVPKDGKLQINVTSAGNDIFYNGSADNSWANKEIAYSDLADEYSFQLQPSQNSGGQGGGTPPASTTIEFQGATISSGTATYEIGEASVNVAVSVESVVANIENNNGHNELSIENSKFDNTIFTLTGFDPDTMKVVIRGSDNYSQELSVTGNSASLSGLHFPGNMVNFSVEAKTPTGPENGSGSGGEGGDNGENGGSNTEETVNLSVTWTGDFGDITIGGHRVNVASGGETFTSARVNSENKIEVIIQAPFAEDYNSIKLNGEEKFTNSMPESRYVFYIPKTDTSLAIVVTKAAATKGTIVWAYDDSFGADAKVENGTVEMVSDFDGTPGHYLVDYDAEVTIKLIPAYGYQVIGAMINGNVPLTANSASNEFKFTMPHTNVHFQGIFTKTDDIVANTSSSVGGASFAGDKVAANGGTAKMTLTDATPADTSSITAEIDTTKAVQAVDITMDQLFYKNSASDVWSNNKTELTDAAQVNLTVNQDAEGYAVLRTHNGVVEEIPANYNSETHTISFASNKYSTYTLVPLTESNNSSGENGNEENNTGSQEVAPTVSESLSAGTTIGGKEINTWSDLEEVLVSQTNGSIANEGEKELLKLMISPNNAAIPANIFTAIAKTEETGLHLFAGCGTAITFLNDDKLSTQGAIDLSCTTIENETGRTIKFNGTGKLSATSVLHSVAPKGINKVTIYLTDVLGNKKKILETAPTAEGRFCFVISELGVYDIEYK